MVENNKRKKVLNLEIVASCVVVQEVIFDFLVYVEYVFVI